MRILMVNNSLDPAYGGPLSCAVNSAMALRLRGHDVVFAGPVKPAAGDRSHEGLAALESSGVTVRSFVQSTLGPLRDREWGVSGPFAQWLLPSVAKADAVVFNSVWSANSLLAVFAARRGKGVPFLLCPHESLTDFDVRRTGGSVKRGLKRVIASMVCRAMDRVIFSSELEEREAFIPLPSNKSGVVGHAVMDEGASSTTRTKMPPHDGTLVLGYLGRFHAKKRIDLIVQALQHLPDTISLRLAGSGEEEASLRRLVVSLGLEKRVRWEGFLGLTEKVDFVRACDLMVMPSDFECFGMSHAEAVCLGVPLITSPLIGIADVIKRYHCGLLVDRTPESVASAIKWYLADTRRLMRAQANCRRAFLENFSFQAHAVGLEAQLQIALATVKSDQSFAL